MIDNYGNEYELYSGKIYISKGKEIGNVTVYMPNSENNELKIIYFGTLNKNHIEEAIVSIGWKLEDWL